MADANRTEWQPIENLPDDWPSLIDPELHSMRQVWREQAGILRGSPAYRLFTDKLRRRAAIETGVIEQLYMLDRGVTETLIERGIQEALIPYSAGNPPAATVAQLIRDQQQAIDGLFDFVKQGRPLSTSYIKQLHQLLTHHQETTTAKDQFGNLITVPLRHGDWKIQPNNPQRPDGSMFYYSPPEQTASQMDQLIAWHSEHVALGVAPEIEAAWLHHRFTLIHPFQDGNGRVAHLLASLVFIQADGFPLVITRDDRDAYIDALEIADRNGLGALVALFVRAQQVAYRAALDLADQSLSEEGASVESILAEVARTLTPGANPRTGPTKSEASALRLLALVESRFKEVAREINDLPKLAIVSSVHSISGRADANNYQVIEMAHKLNYTPNLAHFKAWIKLEISGNVWTEILVAFHGLGRRDLGVLVGAACAYHQAYSDDNDLRLSIDLQLLSMSPFQITAYDELPDLEVRFKKWLETVLIAGLTYWRRGLIL